MNGDFTRGQSSRELDSSVALDRPYRLRDWHQIENPAEVNRILCQIEGATRFDVYERADLYERVYPGYSGDCEFYIRHGSRGRVLFLGAGTGRIFGPIARQNPNAVGIDNSPEMMSVLRRRFPEIADHQLFLGDATRMEFQAASFDTVLAPYSFLQVISSRDLPSLLRAVHRLLRRGGTFIADVFSPYLIPFRKGGLEANVFTIEGETRVGIYIRYDHRLQHMQEMTLFNEDGASTVLEMHLDYYFPRELCERFRAAGFTEPRISGNYNGDSFDPIHHDVVVLQSTRATGDHD